MSAENGSGIFNRTVLSQDEMIRLAVPNPDLREKFWIFASLEQIGRHYHCAGHTFYLLHFYKLLDVRSAPSAEHGIDWAMDFDGKSQRLVWTQLESVRLLQNDGQNLKTVISSQSNDCFFLISMHSK
jgi:hypothetical protein